MSLLLRRLKLHLLSPPSPPFHFLTTSISRLLSATTASPQAPPPNPQFCSAEYLIHSCGLPSDEALRAHKKIQHLKSPVKPDSVLRFLREIGMSQSNIRTAVSRAPRLLCCNIDKNLRPNVAKLREAGISMDDIFAIISRNPGMFTLNFVPKVDFWLGFLGSAENLSVALKGYAALLSTSLEKVILSNLSFLQGQCGLSAPQIVRLIKLDPRLVTSSTVTLKMKAERAGRLGIACSSGMFVYALIITHKLRKCTLVARVNNLKTLGFSQEEVNLMISKAPMLLGVPEDLVSRKMEFLIKEVGCDKINVVRNPVLLMSSLEKRLIPRNIVRKLLMLKELLPGKYKFVNFLKLTEKQFVKKYVLPYKHAIPWLHQTYAEYLKSTSL